ncbi:hypothetical protein P280DRAFT_468572 [Massarina eburnea CBS 473.64]|uniref:MARVEL domain-containing protein n=1 Tax=Massarina eburnea CBS 473.64 TaxID=1395130 RepID=A0A6A6S3K5_9PLEO|nr:hypothetical protein P280DRAFT_468572 [Massarina eburnea CBS 473.64]
MKINPQPLHLAQTVLTGLVVAMGIAILGTAAHTLDVFNKQQSSNPWWLPLWPDHFDAHGTKALVASAVVTLVLSGVFLVMSLIPKLNVASKPTLRALLALGSSAPSAVLCLATIIYAHVLNNQAPDFDTIQTWTCKYKNGHPLQQDLAMPSNMGNANFASLCHQSKFALYGTLVVMLMLIGSSALGVLGWCADKWAHRQQRKEMEVAS